MQIDSMDWEMFLRGAVAGLLLFHLLHLAMPGARPAARAALAIFTTGVLAYLFCQQADVLLSLPRPLVWVLLALCVSTTAWMWVAARALFNDHFAFTAAVLGAALTLVVLGLVAHGPQLLDLGGALPATVVAGLSRIHALAMLGFTVAALWEVARGAQADLVQPRRAARRWVALGIGLYAAVALVVELALRGQHVGRLLPALHVAGIGCVTMALALLVARRSLADILGTDPDLPVPAPADRSAVWPAAQGDPEPMISGKNALLLARLERAMTEQRIYRREGLTLAALAQALEVTEAPLRTLINQGLGYRNFNDYLHHYRLQEAAPRLAREDLPILSIALDCGYGSIGPFNRAFKQRLGMTPSEYRAGARMKPGSKTG